MYIINVDPPESTADASPAPTATHTETTSPEQQADNGETADIVPREHQAALKSAERYLRSLPFSKSGLFRQLTSEFEGFPDDAAQYAADNIDTNWHEQALRAAETYRSTMDMSNEAIRRQLLSNWEGYTHEEVEYALTHLEQ